MLKKHNQTIGQKQIFRDFLFGRSAQIKKMFGAKMGLSGLWFKINGEIPTTYAFARANTTFSANHFLLSKKLKMKLLSTEKVNISKNKNFVSREFF